MNNSLFYWEKPISSELIYSTWAEAFQKKLNKNYFEWRFVNNPDSSRTYISYQLIDGLLASFYAISPVNIKLTDGKIMKSGLVNMAMSHPKFQGKGLLTQCAEDLHEELRKEGFANLVSFPTRDITRRIFRKHFDWVDISTQKILNTKVIKFDSQKIDHSLNWKTVMFSIQHLSIISTLRRFNNTNSFIWSLDDIKWRIIDNPVNNYFVLTKLTKGRCEAIIIYKRYESEIDIMDIYFDESIVKSKMDLLKSIFVEFRIKGFSNNYWVAENSEEYKQIVKWNSLVSNLNTFFGYIPLSKTFCKKEMQEIKVSFIDSDIY